MSTSKYNTSDPQSKTNTKKTFHRTNSPLPNDRKTPLTPLRRNDIGILTRNINNSNPPRVALIEDIQPLRLRLPKPPNAKQPPAALLGIHTIPKITVPLVQAAPKPPAGTNATAQEKPATSKSAKTRVANNTPSGNLKKGSSKSKLKMASLMAGKKAAKKLGDRKKNTEPKRKKAKTVRIIEPLKKTASNTLTKEKSSTDKITTPAETSSKTKLDTSGSDGSADIAAQSASPPSTLMTSSSTVTILNTAEPNITDFSTIPEGNTAVWIRKPITNSNNLMKESLLSRMSRSFHHVTPIGVASAEPNATNLIHLLGDPQKQPRRYVDVACTEYLQNDPLHTPLRHFKPIPAPSRDYILRHSPSIYNTRLAEKTIDKRVNSNNTENTQNQQQQVQQQQDEGQQLIQQPQQQQQTPQDKTSDNDNENDQNSK